MRSITRPRAAIAAAAAATAILLALTGWLYAPILGRLVSQWWSDPNFSHGFFVPVFAGYVLWQDRAGLRAINPAPSLWGLPVILFSLITLILGVFGAELFLSRTSLLLLAAGTTRRTAFSLALPAGPCFTPTCAPD